MRGPARRRRTAAVGLECFLGFFLACLFNASVALAADSALAPGARRPAYAPGEIIVLTDGTAAAGKPAAWLRDAPATRSLGRDARGRRYLRVQLPMEADVVAAAARYRAQQGVIAATPNYLLYPTGRSSAGLASTSVPNDLLLSGQGQPTWAIANDRQALAAAPYTRNNPGTLDSDIDAPEAWSLTTAAFNRIVAVVDTGVDYAHPDLAGAMWDARAARFSGAARPSPFHGYDFGDDDSDPYPVNSDHGTHVAGIVAATGNNGLGSAGIAFNARIMALKIFPDGGGPASNAALIAALNYAVENGADVVNLSIGGSGDEDPVLTAAMRAAVDAGVVVVAAAGNDASDITRSQAWPANYAAHPATAAGVISVMASDQADQPATFTNFGDAVTLAAPGVNIMSTVPARTVRQAERGHRFADGASASCAASPTNCLDYTIFDGIYDDCGGSSNTRCRFGWRKDRGTFYLLGDIEADAERYTPNTHGVLTTRAVNTAGATRLVLRYRAAWDLECDRDYVRVSVYDGNDWRVLRAPALNVGESGGRCETAHTHSGRMARHYGAQAIAFDISAYANANLRVRIDYFTDGTNNATALRYGFQLWDFTLDAQANDYSFAYAFKNGTSMAAPIASGIAALLKTRYPHYSPAAIKEAIAAQADAVPTLANSVGGRANAYRAVRDVTVSALTPAQVSAGSGGFTLTLAGRNFTPDMVAYWDGAPRPTVYRSATEIGVVIDANDVAHPGDVQVQLQTGARDFASNARTFAVTATPALQEGGGCTLARTHTGVDPLGFLLVLAALFRARRYVHSNALIRTRRHSLSIVLIRARRSCGWATRIRARS